MSRVAYQSSQSDTDSSPTALVVITKPVSLAVGDMMVAQISGSNTIGNPTITPPSVGWTATIPQANPNATDSYAMYTKIADASDVAATNFTFTIDRGATGTSVGHGFIHRITGNDLTVAVVASNSGTGSNASALSSSGITPGNQCLFLILVGHITLAASRTISAYAVANSNPTWTERADATSLLATLNVGCAMATGPSSLATASGNATATASGAVGTYQLAILAIQPEIFRPTVLSVVFSVLTPVIPVVVKNAVSAVFSVLTPVFEAIATAWTNEDVKHVASWDTDDKSTP